MAIASFIQANGQQLAAGEWSQAITEEERYQLIRQYLAYGPESLGDYMPANYRVELPAKILPLQKARLFHRMEPRERGRWKRRGH